MTLFRWGTFTSAAGLVLPYKIECDALTADDWYCIAAASAPRIGAFSSAIGVPRGGFPLGRAMQHFKSGHGPVLIVDDVWTTGRSMTEFASGITGWIGFVAFARGPLPPNVVAFAQINQGVTDPLGFQQGMAWGCQGS